MRATGCSTSSSTSSPAPSTWPRASRSWTTSERRVFFIPRWCMYIAYRDRRQIKILLPTACKSAKSWTKLAKKNYPIRIQNADISKNRSAAHVRINNADPRVRICDVMLVRFVNSNILQHIDWPEISIISIYPLLSFLSRFRTSRTCSCASPFSSIATCTLRSGSTPFRSVSVWST